MAYDKALHRMELDWLRAAVAYEVHDDPIMDDHLWDALGVELWRRRAELSAPFCHLVFKQWPAPVGEAGENPLKTASGIDWSKGHGLLFAQAHRKS